MTRVQTMAESPPSATSTRWWLTKSGPRQVDFVSALIRDWIIDKLTRSPNFQGRPHRAQVEDALNRIARRST